MNNKFTGSFWAIFEGVQEATLPHFVAVSKTIGCSKQRRQPKCCELRSFWVSMEDHSFTARRLGEQLGRPSLVLKRRVEGE